MKNKTISQKVTFDTSPEVLYDMLMQEKKHAAFTGAEAKITNRIGGKFSAWDNYITGKNILLEKGKKIVQEWWCADLPDGHITIITFTFSVIKKNSTQLEFMQTNVPPDQYKALAKGWQDFYWTPMKEYLAELNS